MNCSTCEIGYRKQVAKQIKLNVKNHDNREYDLVGDICKFYRCTDGLIFKPKRYDSHIERDLYIYCMVKIMKWSQVKVATILKMQESNVSRDLKGFFDRYKGKEIENIFSFLRKY